MDEKDDDIQIRELEEGRFLYALSIAVVMLDVNEGKGASDRFLAWVDRALEVSPGDPDSILVTVHTDKAALRLAKALRQSVAQARPILLDGLFQGFPDSSSSPPTTDT